MTTPNGALPQLPADFFRRYDERPDELLYVSEAASRRYL
jgi:hypothetical protein